MLRTSPIAVPAKEQKNAFCDSCNVCGMVIRMKIVHKHKMIFYACSMLLACFYLTVLWWGKHPNVGIEYRMYYITHELSDWPGYGKLYYTPGVVEYCTELKNQEGKELSNVCRRKGQGFAEWQYNGSVNAAETATLYYLLRDDIKHAEYACSFNDFSGQGSVSIYCNDVLIGTANEKGAYRFFVGDLPKEECITIKFVAKDCKYRLMTTALFAE